MVEQSARVPSSSRNLWVPNLAYRLGIYLFHTVFKLSFGRYRDLGNSIDQSS